MFKLILKKKAQKFLEKVDRPTERRLSSAILDLKYNPAAGDIKKLSGRFRGVNRLRVGDFRILFTCNSNSEEITIYDINNRGDVY